MSEQYWQSMKEEIARRQFDSIKSWAQFIEDYTLSVSDNTKIERLLRDTLGENTYEVEDN